MSFYHFGHITRSFLQQDGLPFSAILSEQTIQRIAAAAGVPPSPPSAPAAATDDTIYTPAVTLWAFLSQVLHKGPQRSCVAAVARVLVLCVALGRPRASPDNRFDTVFADRPCA